MNKRPAGWQLREIYIYPKALKRHFHGNTLCNVTFSGGERDLVLVAAVPKIALEPAAALIQAVFEPAKQKMRSVLFRFARREKAARP
jgi:hypothetical protein